MVEGLFQKTFHLKPVRNVQKCLKVAKMFKNVFEIQGLKCETVTVFLVVAHR